MNVYRFRDDVAINPPDGPTFYLSKAQARFMATALRRVATDIVKCKFVDSDLRKCEIENRSQ